MNREMIELVKALLLTPGETTTAGPSDVGKRVLVRTYSAGVHFGTLESRSGEECRLRAARRIWSWKGANTLHEIALRGVDTSASRVSEAVDAITLTNAIEIIPLAAAAIVNLDGASWKS